MKGDHTLGLVKLLRQLTDDQHGYEYSDIVILSLKSEADSIMAEISKVSGIPITREHTNSSVMFTTARKFKGLESRVIIVVDIDENSFRDNEKKRLFYVACSRATQRLALIVNGNDEKIKAIATAINNDSHYAPKGQVAMKTQSKILELE